MRPRRRKRAKPHRQASLRLVHESRHHSRTCVFTGGEERLAVPARGAARHPAGLTMRRPRGRPARQLSRQSARMSAALLVLSVTTLTGCHPILRKRNLDVANPTSFVFSASPAEVCAAATKAVERIVPGDAIFGSRWKERHIQVATNDAKSPFGQEIFERPENAEDLYLHSFFPPLCDPDVYLCRGKPADFDAAFHLHLTRVDQSKTQVDVIALKPTALCGSYLGVPGHGRAGRLVDVSPTSIEEYRLLLAIGRELSVEGMPPL